MDAAAAESEVKRLETEAAQQEQQSQREAHALAVAQELLREEEEAARSAQAKREAKRRKQDQRRARDLAKLQPSSRNAPHEVALNPLPALVLHPAAAALTPTAELDACSKSLSMARIMQKSLPFSAVSSAAVIRSEAFTQPLQFDSPGIDGALPASNPLPDGQGQISSPCLLSSASADPVEPFPSSLKSTALALIGVSDAKAAQHSSLSRPQFASPAKEPPTVSQSRSAQALPVRVSVAFGVTSLPAAGAGMRPTARPRPHGLKGRLPSAAPAQTPPRPSLQGSAAQLAPVGHNIEA